MITNMRLRPYTVAYHEEAALDELRAVLKHWEEELRFYNMDLALFGLVALRFYRDPRNADKTAVTDGIKERLNALLIEVERMTERLGEHLHRLEQAITLGVLQEQIDIRKDYLRLEDDLTILATDFREFKQAVYRSTKHLSPNK